MAARTFESLSEQEIRALAITLEEEDARVYADFAVGLKENYPASSAGFAGMHQEEIEHRNKLHALFVERFGEHVPLLRREDVRGFVKRRPVWLMKPMGLDVVRKQAAVMELETRFFYEHAAARAQDPSIRQLLTELAKEEASHSHRAEELAFQELKPDARAEEDELRRRLFLMQVVQPGLAGLMDGSVSTLAPVFAAAFATHSSHDAFLVGMAASIGAGISMGFAEALSDDGNLTGRGQPWLRGLVCGLMTTLGGIGHTLPYLIPSFQAATALAVLVVAAELAAIAWIRKKYMDTPLLAATLQVVVGGVLVLLTGILLGSS
jgi:erythrin-vacuolar iron transport family protein